MRCEYNQIITLDVSNNTALDELDCRENALSSLDLRNGNNTDLEFLITNNPNLYCIDVDDFQYSYNNWFNIDAQMYFSEDCSAK